MTAAAATGPARAPRPASSTPAICYMPAFQSFSSKDRFGEGGNRLGSKRFTIRAILILQADFEDIDGHLE